MRKLLGVQFGVSGLAARRLVMDENPDELHLRRAERIRIYEAMLKYGGGFARALGEAFIRADDENERRLRSAFPEIFEHYREMARVSESENERPDF